MLAGLGGVKSTTDKIPLTFISNTIIELDGLDSRRVGDTAFGSAQCDNASLSVTSIASPDEDSTKILGGLTVEYEWPSCWQSPEDAVIVGGQHPCRRRCGCLGLHIVHRAAGICKARRRVTAAPGNTRGADGSSRSAGLSWIGSQDYTTATLTASVGHQARGKDKADWRKEKSARRPS